MPRKPRKIRTLKKFDINRELTKLYNEKNNFIQQNIKDLECYFNLNEFARIHDIDGVKYLGVLTSDTRTQKITQFSITQDNVLALSKSTAILFLKCEDIESVHAEQPIRIDGRLYQIESAEKIGGVIWRISLSGTMS